MMPIDRVWALVKETSQRYGACGRRLSQAEAERVVRAICANDRMPELPQEAIDYFARELVRLTRETLKRD
jgi:hypothetical protein